MNSNQDDDRAGLARLRRTFDDPSAYLGERSADLEPATEKVEAVDAQVAGLVVGGWGAPLAEFPADAWDKVLDLNVKSPFFLTRALLPQLEAAATADDPARVINIGSGSMFDGVDTQVHYVAAKAGVLGLSRSLARVVGKDGITVNLVAPGLTMTPAVAKPISSPASAPMAMAALCCPAIPMWCRWMARTGPAIPSRPKYATAGLRAAAPAT